MGAFPIGVFGIAALLGVAFLLSFNRRAIQPWVVAKTFAMQAGIAFLVLYVPAGRAAIEGMAKGVAALLSYAQAGTDFVFGPLASPELGGKAFALAALPVIIFFASLVSILYYLRIMQWMIRWIGGAIEWVTGISKVESLYTAANIFVGQSEAPLVIRPYLAGLSPSRLFAVMSVGMAGVAGTILAAYAAMGVNIQYLLAAGFMAAPGGLLMAKIIMPDEMPPRTEPLSPDEDILVREEIEGEEIVGDLEEERPTHIIMAAAMGARTGVQIAVAVGAMMLAFVALVALANGLLGALGGVFGYPNLSFQGIVGTLFAPILYLTGIPWQESSAAGALFGTKIILNEFVAFLALEGAQGLSERSVAMVTFALCGFANISSIAVQMAVMGSLAPNQQPVIARLGVRALIAGSLANLMSATLAGLMLP